jgi:hypothetical protein
MRSLNGQVASLQLDLVGPDPSPLERLQAERVVLCWLQLHQAELLVLDAERKAQPIERPERRRDRAHRRYLQAIEALAQIRRLNLPAPFRLNVGTRQVIAPNGLGAKAPGSR